MNNQEFHNTYIFVLIRDNLYYLCIKERKHACVCRSIPEVIYVETSANQIIFLNSSSMFLVNFDG